jgi:hypothetical protein
MSDDQSNHALTLEIPTPVYASLVKVAEQLRQQPEELAIHWLTAVLEKWEDDPLEKFIGAFNSNVPDWLDRHDAYLGQASLNSNSENAD